MQIHQVLVSASPGDAITNAAFEIRALLRHACPSEIFARYIHPDVADDVFELERIAQRHGGRQRDDLVLYHASIGDPDVHALVCDRPERLVVLYHNISPAEAFLPYAPGFASLLSAGRRDLARMRDRVTLALADSEFNASELVELGYRDVRVSPLIIDTSALHDAELDEGTANHLATVIDGPVLLFVGQLLPHKRPELLVEAFHVLVTYLVPNTQLILAGKLGLPRFSDALQAQISELNLHRVWLAGAVSRGTLRSFYERADAFVTTSDHEGFCVPLVEAMSFGLPVVARATTAIPETLAGAGLLIPRSDGPIALAEALAEVLTDTALRHDLAATSAHRLGDFDPDSARRQFLSHLLSVA